MDRSPLRSTFPERIGSFLSSITELEILTGVFAQPKTGLGTGIVDALAKQLDAKVETVSGPGGTSVSITHATFAAKETRSSRIETALRT